MAKQKQTQEIAFEEVVERGCGLDVHKKEIVATVSGTGIESETRTFQSTTRSLSELKEWLLALGVTHVSKESTGVYWKPVMNNPTASCRYNPRANLSLCLKTNYKHEVLEISTSQLFF